MFGFYYLLGKNYLERSCQVKPETTWVWQSLAAIMLGGRGGACSQQALKGPGSPLPVMLETEPQHKAWELWRAQVPSLPSGEMGAYMSVPATVGGTLLFFMFLVLLGFGGWHWLQKQHCCFQRSTDTAASGFDNILFNAVGTPKMGQAGDSASMLSEKASSGAPGLGKRHLAQPCSGPDCLSTAVVQYSFLLPRIKLPFQNPPPATHSPPRQGLAPHVNSHSIETSQTPDLYRA